MSPEGISCLVHVLHESLERKSSEPFPIAATRLFVIYFTNVSWIWAGGVKSCQVIPLSFETMSARNSRPLRLSSPPPSEGSCTQFPDQHDTGPQLISKGGADNETTSLNTDYLIYLLPHITMRQQVYHLLERLGIGKQGCNVFKDNPLFRENLGYP